MTGFNDNSYVRPLYGSHPTHCCERHGCKYGKADCPVKAKIVQQEYPCEYCVPPEELRTEIRKLQAELDWSISLQERNKS